MPDKRDPRREPKAGDVTRNQRYSEFQVLRLEGDVVCYLANGVYEETDIIFWQEYAVNDEVVHAAD